jgi:hypothetical protein
MPSESPARTCQHPDTIEDVYQSEGAHKALTARYPLGATDPNTPTLLVMVVVTLPWLSLSLSRRHVG